MKFGWHRKAAVAAAIAVLAFPPGAEAAIRLCQQMVTGGARSGETLPVAQRAALAAWVNAVTARHGPRYTAWRIAYRKALECRAEAGGGNICEACGQPCGIEYVKPPKVVPLPRLWPVPPDAVDTPPIGCQPADEN